MFDMITAIETTNTKVAILFNTCPNTDEHPSHAVLWLDVKKGCEILARMYHTQQIGRLFKTELDHVRFCNWDVKYFDNDGELLEFVKAESLATGDDGQVVEEFTLPEEQEHNIDASYLVCDANRFWFEATDDSSDEPFMTYSFNLAFLLSQMVYLSWNGNFTDMQGVKRTIADLYM